MAAVLRAPMAARRPLPPLHHSYDTVATHRHTMCEYVVEEGRAAVAAALEARVWCGPVYALTVQRVSGRGLLTCALVPSDSCGEWEGLRTGSVLLLCPAGRPVAKAAGDLASGRGDAMLAIITSLAREDASPDEADEAPGLRPHGGCGGGDGSKPTCCTVLAASGGGSMLEAHGRCQAVCVLSLTPARRMYHASDLSGADLCFRWALLGLPSARHTRFDEDGKDGEDGGDGEGGPARRPPPSAPSLPASGHTSAGSAAIASLNESQRRPVAAFLREVCRGGDAARLHLLHGPPGTGKSRALVSLLLALSELEGVRILFTAPSNKAVRSAALELLRLLRAARHEVRRGVGGEPLATREVALIGLRSRLFSADGLSGANEGESGEGEEGEEGEWDEAEDARDEACDASALRRIYADAMPTLASAAAWRVGAPQVEQPVAETREERLARARIVFCTLSSAGRPVLREAGFRPDVLLVDEAAQSVEPEALIPLALGPRHVLLAGDPRQLPATLLSRAAAAAGFGTSLMERLMLARAHGATACPCSMLGLQYRMHPAISAFPSAASYGGALRDGVAGSERARPWHGDAPLPGSPYALVHVEGAEAVEGASHSLYNEAEARLVLELVARFEGYVTPPRVPPQVVVVSPYAAQLRHLRRGMRSAGLAPDSAGLHTVDSFQGGEAEVVLLSLVRTTRSGRGGGFAADAQRLNVALTRASCSLLVLGDLFSLAGHAAGRALLGDATRRGLCLDGAALSAALRASPRRPGGGREAGGRPRADADGALMERLRRAAGSAGAGEGPGAAVAPSPFRRPDLELPPRHEATTAARAAEIENYVRERARADEERAEKRRREEKRVVAIFAPPSVYAAAGERYAGESGAAAGGGEDEQRGDSPLRLEPDQRGMAP